VIVLIASTALLGGLAEAGFLVLATKTGLAVSAHEDTVSLFGGFNLSLRLSIGLAGLLVLCKVAAGVLSGRWSSINTSHISLELDGTGSLSRSLGRSTEVPGWDSFKTFSRPSPISSAIARRFRSRIVRLQPYALLLLSFVVEPIGSLIVVVVKGLLSTVMRPVRNLIRRRRSVSHSI
jgi:hypothetical protein